MPWKLAKCKLLSSVNLTVMHDLFTKSFLHFYWNYRSASKEKTVFLNFKTGKGIHKFTYSIEVPVGLQHDMFVELLLRRIQQSPLLLSEVHMHVLISHCILEHHIHVYKRNHNRDKIISWHRSSTIATSHFRRKPNNEVHLCHFSPFE